MLTLAAIAAPPVVVVAAEVSSTPLKKMSTVNGAVQSGKRERESEFGAANLFLLLLSFPHRRWERWSPGSGRS